ncbi:MAG: hypothetical protein KGD67_13105 [Candidatus Lokiarchaeota archaeon]|nr:hypothetical protein [Candidatus Lokiarchaeota archaeon]
MQLCKKVEKISWGESFALLSRYYALNPEQIIELSLYQFQTYLNNIAVIEGLFHGTKPKPEIEKMEDDNLLIEQAKALGLKVPTKIIAGENK